MAKRHWRLPDTTAYGCQQNTCQQPATWQWQRHMTPAEIETTQAQPGPYGTVHHADGPHLATVFACEQHTPKIEVENQLQHDLDKMAKTHKTDCPAPDPGCKC